MRSLSGPRSEPADVTVSRGARSFAVARRQGSLLLILPLRDEARRRIKAFIEVASQRGGQIIASLLILALGLLQAPLRVLGAVLAILAAAWLATALSLRAPYLEIFRARLRTGRLPHLDEFPELDAASLETLLRALDSDNDKQVMAALSVLERENKVDLIPALTLLHPSAEVVESALAIFARAKRANVVHVVDRVLEHPSPRVRAASIAARSVLRPDSQLLLRRLELEDSEEVRAAIVVNLIIAGEIDGHDAKTRLDAFLNSGSVPTRVALAEAIAERGAAAFDHVLLELSTAREAAVRTAAVSAMGRLTAPGFLARLVDALAEEATRRAAEGALLNYGEQGLAALCNALRQPTRPLALRRRIPHAMSVFHPAAASSALLAWLTSEPDPSVRYQMIRALQRLARESPLASAERALLRAAIEHALAEAFRHLDERAILTARATRVRRDAPGHELLRSLLEQLEHNATERLFLLLGLAYPKEDFAQIYRGLLGSKDTRATSMELIAHVVAEPLRSAVVGLVDDAPDAERLSRAGRYHRPLHFDYEALLAHLLASESEAVQDVVTFHLGELGLTSLRAHIEAVPNPHGARADLTLVLAQLLRLSPSERAT